MTPGDVIVEGLSGEVGEGAEGGSELLDSRPGQVAAGPRLVGMFVYPVKSCGGVAVTSWPLGPCGLLYDREWCVTDPRGVALTQKSEPRLATIRPRLLLRGLSQQEQQQQQQRHAGGSGGSAAESAQALTTDVLVLQCSDAPGSFAVVPVGGPEEVSDGFRLPVVRDVTVCGEACRALLVSSTPRASAEAAAELAASSATAAAPGDSLGVLHSDVNAWLSLVLGRPVCLVRRVPRGEGSVPRPARGDGSTRPGSEGMDAPSGSRSSNGDGSGSGVTAGGGSGVGFANDGQFLLVSTASVDWLDHQMHTRYREAGSQAPFPKVDVEFFRPNLVLGPLESLRVFAEETWSGVCIGGWAFQVQGPCMRCRMINIDQSSGENHAKGEPLLTLSKCRRTKAGVFFGVFLSSADCREVGPDEAVRGVGQPWVHVGDPVVPTVKAV